VIHNGFKSARPLARLKAGRSDWYRIDVSNTAKASIYIYDEIGYVGVSAKDFVQDLNEIKAPEIELHIDSPGGDVYDGITIYNAIRDHKAHITTIVDSMAASAASYIAQAGDRRVMNRNSEMMIHDGHTVAIGNSSDLVAMAERLDKISDNIASIYADRAGNTVQYWRELMRAETWYSGDEAVDAGLADEVAGKETESRNDFDLTIFSYAGRDHAPAPVLAKQETPEEVPDAGIDWTHLADALKGAFA
jgi:ATP-dependent Clp endopeptidase proteolytic subunit ClpP